MADEKIANGATDTATKAVAAAGKKAKATAAKVPCRLMKRVLCLLSAKFTA